MNPTPVGGFLSDLNLVFGTYEGTHTMNDQTKPKTRGRRKIGNVGLAYLDAVEKRDAEKRAKAAQAIAKVAKAAA